MVPLYEESDLHRGGGVSWRKQIGRGWGIHAVYDVSTTRAIDRDRSRAAATLTAAVERQRSQSFWRRWLGRPARSATCSTRSRCA